MEFQHQHLASDNLLPRPAERTSDPTPQTMPHLNYSEVYPASCLGCLLNSFPTTRKSWVAMQRALKNGEQRCHLYASLDCSPYHEFSYCRLGKHTRNPYPVTLSLSHRSPKPNLLVKSRFRIAFMARTDTWDKFRPYMKYVIAGPYGYMSVYSALVHAGIH